ncbi:hypothetical protein [Tsukamurella soli]|uniref:hypothetical protein n=1 Tax=Tsukamurella soli TaxID=644556 RepID=UPI0036116316
MMGELSPNIDHMNGAVAELNDAVTLMTAAVAPMSDLVNRLPKRILRGREGRGHSGQADTHSLAAGRAERLSDAADDDEPSS